MQIVIIICVVGVKNDSKRLANSPFNGKIMLTWIILKNKDRYPGIAKDMPDCIQVFGTKEQAIALAVRLTNYEAGCDYAFYVLGVDDVDD